MLHMDSNEMASSLSSAAGASTLRRRRGGGGRIGSSRDSDDSGGNNNKEKNGKSGSTYADRPAEVDSDAPVATQLLRGISAEAGRRREAEQSYADTDEKRRDTRNNIGAEAGDDNNDYDEGSASADDAAGVGALPFLPGYPVVGANSTADLSLIDRHFKIVALASAVVWAVLAALCYALVPPDRVVRVEGVEQTAALFAFALLLLGCLGRLMPLFYSDLRSIRSGLLVCSLVVQGVALITDFVMAFLPTPVLVDPILGTRVHLLRWCEWTPLAFAMTFMTEGIDVPRGGSERAGKHLRVHYVSAACQGLSTGCGLLFPLATNGYVWSVLMLISCVLFAVIFPRVQQKRTAFLRAERGASVDEIEVYDRVRLSYRLLSTCSAVWSLLVVMFFIAGLGPTFAPEGSFLRHPALPMITEASMDVVTKSLFMGIIIDVHDLVFNDAARAERRLEELRQMMSVVWESSSDVIVISVRGISGACTTMLSPTYLRMYQGKGKEKGKERRKSSEPANAVVFDLEASEFEPEGFAGADAEAFHADADDDDSPSHRRGSQSSSASGVAAKNLYLGDNVRSPANRKRVIKPKMVHKVQFTGLSNFSSSSENRSSAGGASDHAKRSYMASNDELSSMADLVVNAWSCRGDHTLLMHDLVSTANKGGGGEDSHGEDDKEKAGGGPSTVRCEATVNRLDENALVIVMRDISERFKRFEAEKRVISETTARMKDAEANRFTRHEVKNGLLAAIGLCDSLKETLSGLELTATSAVAVAGASGSPGTGNPGNLGTPQPAEPASNGVTDGVVLNQLAATDASRCIVELDKTLNEILDTVLSEAMARDVIHEAYEPKMGRVNVLNLLAGSTIGDGSGQKSRFPIITDPVPLPLLMSDPQLLKYIHRNAVSNACKYGKKGGVVTTMIRFDEDTSELEMDIINMPGEHHTELLKLKDKARDAVFSPGKRLHRSFHSSGYSDSVLVSHSSGDGAWIMQKCARTLGGECDIQFDRRRTVFSFRCPVTAYDKAIRSTSALDNYTDFQVPVGSWGIAIDDSKIQRTLLHRFLRIAGVEEDRSIVLGGGRSEIEGFDDMVVQLIDQHPNEYFLLIVDENLDIMEDQTCHKTVSGSLLVENIRHRLLPDQERRMLALVRSANDSSHDVAIYNSRAHGFLPKTPVHRELVLELLAPLWQKRHLYKPSLHEQHSLPDGSGSDDGFSASSTAMRRASRMPDEDEEAHHEIGMVLESVDNLLDCDEAEMEERWGVIWEKLHGLKGDVTTIFESPMVGRVTEEINAMRGRELPQGIISKWASVRSLVRSIMTEVEEQYR